MKIAIQSGSSANEIGFADTYRMFAQAGFESIDWNINDRLPGSQIRGGTYEGIISMNRSLF